MKNYIIKIFSENRLALSTLNLVWKTIVIVGTIMYVFNFGNFLKFLREANLTDLLESLLLFLSLSGIFILPILMLEFVLSLFLDKTFFLKKLKFLKILEIILGIINFLFLISPAKIEYYQSIRHTVRDNWLYRSLPLFIFSLIFIIELTLNIYYSLLLKKKSS